MPILHLHFTPNPPGSKALALSPSIHLSTDCDSINEEIDLGTDTDDGRYELEYFGTLVDFLLLSGQGHPLHIEASDLPKTWKTSHRYPLKLALSDDGVIWTATHRGKELAREVNEENREMFVPGKHVQGETNREPSSSPAHSTGTQAATSGTGTTLASSISASS